MPIQKVLYQIFFQTTPNIFDNSDDETTEAAEADGLLLYLSVRFKKEYQREAERSIQDLLRRTDPSAGDVNNNAGQRSSPDGKTSDESGDHRSDQDEDDEETGLKTGRNGRNGHGGISNGKSNGKSNGYRDADGNYVDGYEYQDDDDLDEYEEFEEEIVDQGKITKPR